MENNITINKLIKCSHCLGKGTCLIDNNHSCGTCLKVAKLKKKFNITICSVCYGEGMIVPHPEPYTERLKNRIPVFIVVIVLAVFYFYALLNLIFRTNFDVIFPVVGSLTTMIVTFYFSQKIKD